MDDTKLLEKAFKDYKPITRKDVYANWDKVIAKAKKDGYDYIKHETEDPSADFTFPETVALNPEKTLVKGGIKPRSTFYDSLDVPKEDLIIRNEGGKAMSVDPLESLKQEARKYKSAEEFVKAQGEPLYHGTNASFDKYDPNIARNTGEMGGNLWGFGQYTSPNIGTAKNYGSNIMEYYGKPKKPLDLSSFKTKEALADHLDMSPDALTTINGIPTASQSQAAQLSSHARDMGYDAIVGNKGQEIVLLDNSQLLNRKQLTDLYNQATAKPTTPKPVVSEPQETVTPQQPSQQTEDQLSSSDSAKKNTSSPKQEGQTSKPVEDKQTSNLIISEAKTPGGQVVQNVRTGKGKVERIRAAKRKVLPPLNEVGAIGTDVRPTTDSAVDQNLQTDTNLNYQNPRMRQQSLGIGDTSPQQQLTSVSQQPRIPEMPPQIPSVLNASRSQLTEPSSQNIKSRAPEVIQNSQTTLPEQNLNTSTSEPKIAQSRFAKRAASAQELSPELQASVKQSAPKYEKTTNESQLAASEELLSKGYKKAAVDVSSRLDNKTSGSDAQTVSDAIAVIKKLDEKGGTGNLQQSTELIEKLSERLTQAGQTVQAASLLSNRTPQGLYHGAIRTLKKAGVDITTSLQQQLQEKLAPVKSTKAGTPEGDLARYQFIEQVNKLVPAKATDKAVQLWKAGLLTAPTTTAGNLTANTLEQALKRGFEDPVATGADILMSAFTGKRSKTLTGRGVISGGKEGIVKGISYFKTGFDPRNPNQKFDIKEIHYSDTPLGRAAEEYTQSVFKLMGSQDQPFYYASLRNSLYDQAITEAKNAGVTGKARSEFIKKFVTQPSKKAMQLADTEARYDVFQNKTALGEAASGLKGKTGAVGDFFIPFSGVPSSIATRIVERTPIGTATEVVKQMRTGTFNQRRMAQAISRGTTGLVLIGVGKALANSTDMLTLGYPKDDKERKLWELEGKQPYSIKIGGKWRSLNYFQPAGTLIAAGGEYAKAKKEGASEQEAWSRAIASAGKALSDQSFLKGVSGTLNAVQDPAQFGSRLLEQTAGSVVPNIVRSYARALDPKQRQINGVKDAVVAGIPVLNQTLAPKVNAFGEDVRRRSTATNSFLNPSRPSDVLTTDATGKELRRLQDAGQGVMTPNFAKNTLGGNTKLNEKQITELQKTIYPEIKQTWDMMISDERYKSLDDEGKMKVLRDAAENIASARKAQYAADNNLGKFAPDYTGKEQKLSYKEKSVLKGSAVDFLTADAKEQDFNKSPDAEYKYKLAQYEDKKAKGEINDIEDIKAKKELAKLEVGSKYEKKTRDLYSLSKNDIYDYVTTSQKDGKKLAEQVIAYDKALYDAGLISTRKFKDGVIAASSKGGKGGGKKKSTIFNLSDVYSAQTSSAKRLQQLLAGTTVKAPSSAPKTRKPVLKKVGMK